MSHEPFVPPVGQWITVTIRDGPHAGVCPRVPLAADRLHIGHRGRDQRYRKLFNEDGMEVLDRGLSVYVWDSSFR